MPAGTLIFEGAMTVKQSQILLCADWHQMGANEQADAIMYAYTAGAQAAKYASAIGLLLDLSKALYLSLVVTPLYLSSVISSKVHGVWIERCNPAVVYSDLRIDAFLRAIAEEPKPAAPFLRSGKMHCHKCKRKTFPKLLETGCTVTHRFIGIENKTIKAEGWDGTASDVGEEGDELLLECQHCFAEFRLPKGYKVEWQ